MSAIIYYFTGTGNSYAVAREVAAACDGVLQPIAALDGAGEIVPAADKVGVVCPVYYGDLPPMVQRFLARLRGLEGRHIFAVCTYGGGRGNALKSLRAALAESGGRLGAFYGIHMPQNAFAKPKERRARLYRRAHAMARRIAGHLAQGRRGVFASEPLADWLQRPLAYLLRPVYRRHLVAAASGEAAESNVALMARLDRSFRVTADCGGCGLCAVVCPAGNVVMEGVRPTWLGHCENCLACYNFCPQRAIRTALVQEDYYYLHPDYALSMARRQRG